jgi:hypothetical protein
MLSRTTRKSTVTRLTVWVVVTAFCICLFAPSAFSESGPNNPRTKTHFNVVSDDSGWGTEQLRSESFQTWYSLIELFFRNKRPLTIIDRRQPRLEPSIEHEQDVTTGTSRSGSTATE